MRLTKFLVGETNLILSLLFVNALTILKQTNKFKMDCMMSTICKLLYMS